MNTTPTEYEITCQVADYLDLLQKQGKVQVFTHAAQETFTKSWGVKMKNKKMGVHPGLADFVIVSPSTILFLELKRLKGGVVSPEQKNWFLALQNRPGVSSVIAKGFEEAKKYIDDIAQYATAIVY